MEAIKKKMAALREERDAALEQVEAQKDEMKEKDQKCDDVRQRWKFLIYYSYVF